MRRRMFIMLAIVVAVIGILGFVKYRQISAAIKAGGSFKQPPETVTTVVAKIETWHDGLEAVGSVAATQGVMLSADLPGVVKQVLFQSGTRVRAGQTLAVLDTQQERAQLAAAEAQADLAKTNLDRSQRLLDMKVIAQSDFDQVAAQYKQAAATADVYRATIARKTIRAPFAGIAGIRIVNIGEYVQGGDPIVTLRLSIPSTWISRCRNSRWPRSRSAPRSRRAPTPARGRWRPGASRRSTRWSTRTRATSRCRPRSVTPADGCARAAT